ncbi:MAG: ImmA/IrrE family metallo-endopeptidase [Fibrobacter sp.]|nr:ImmA/IrrE family metallo-endopeptidase [Fibrobacter sp.]
MKSFDEKEKKKLDELIHEVGVYRNSKDLKELLDFIKKFPKIAPFNALLLHIQKPGSKYVASASEWKERFKRTIKPGARPLVILWPFAPVHFVFELEDTDGKDPFPEALQNPFKTNGTIQKSVFERFVRNLPSVGVSYHEADHGTESAGYIKPAKEKSVQVAGKKHAKILYRMVVNQNHSKEEKFATIAHELGHLYCGHLGTPSVKMWPDRSKEGINREFEAESVAWLVCERAGIKNPSAEYISGYLKKNEQIPQISLENVLKAAGMIEAMTLRILSLRKEIVA